MKTWKVCLVIILIFLAGFAAGSVVTRTLTRRAVARVLRDPNQLRLLVERRLNRRLRLDFNQRRQVDAILTRTEGELKDLRRQFAPPLRNIMSNAQNEISAVLTPEQQKAFEQFRADTRPLWQPR